MTGAVAVQQLFIITEFFLICQKQYTQRIGAAVGGDRTAGFRYVYFGKFHRILNGLSHGFYQGFIDSGMGDENVIPADIVVF